MLLWRISRHHDLSGLGGWKASGRWHHSGQTVVYLAENHASALLKSCVHTAANDVPPNFILLRIKGPGIEVPEITLNQLTSGWQKSLELTRRLGTSWLRQKTTFLLRVPSAITPHTANYMFNPLHEDAPRFRIAEALEYPFDSRLKE